MLFISSKNSFYSRDIQIFVFPSSRFSPVGHNVIKCVGENLITHFIWYFEKENRYDDETFK